MEIGELNTKITFNTYDQVQDEETGRVVPTPVDTWRRWAKVVQDSMNKTLESLAVTYKEAYTITKRYEASKPTPNDATITLGTKVLTIGSVVKKDIGQLWFEVITAYTTQ